MKMIGWSGADGEEIKALKDKNKNEVVCCEVAEKMRMTKRDIEILEFINEFGFCDIAQLMARYKLKRAWMQEIMYRLVSVGLINHDRVLHGHKGVYSVTAKGAKFTDLPAMDQISLAQYLHQHAIVSTYLKLHKQYPDAEWTSERRLKRDKFFDGVGKRGHVPDGILTFPDGKKVAIEVELSVKGRNRLEKILKTYRAQIEISEVWYFCASNVLNVMKTISAKMSFVKVYDFNVFISLTNELEAVKASSVK